MIPEDILHESQILAEDEMSFPKPNIVRSKDRLMFKYDAENNSIQNFIVNFYFCLPHTRKLITVDLR